jgi:prepilin-type N-terminal cleavage/methylation domain-containing protein
MTKQLKQRGFTIVELLIVVVIIAILAAITIVAYNGIQNRAKSSSIAASAASLQKKLEAYNIDQTAWPATVSVLTGAATSTVYYLPTGTVTQMAADPTTANLPGDAKSVTFYKCVTGGNPAGYQIKYWDYNSATAKQISGGDTSGTCSIVTT